MPAKVKIIRAKDFLQVTEDGVVDFESSKKMLTDVAKAKRPPADFDVLIDLRRAQWRLNTADIYYLASALAEIPDAYRSKIAVLVLPGADFKQAEFLEICSKNRGLTVEAFTNFEDAIQWFFSTQMESV